MKTLTILMTLLLSSVAFGSTVAIIDSGTDMLHKDLHPQAWFNPVDATNNDRDEDRNGYPDDVHGWNFAEANNKVIDYSYLGRLNDDTKKFFEIQERMMRGTASDADMTWLREKVQDADFIKNLQIYGNFMHGTHVAGITAKLAPQAKILAVKLIPTEVKLPFTVVNPENGLGMFLLKQGLGALAKQQMKLMVEIGAYVDGHAVDIANGSFGTGYAQAKMIVETLAKTILRRDPTEAETKELCLHFLNTLIKEGLHFVSEAQDTLFVFAAGNDGANNDQYPTSPANIDAPNVITVAATMDRNQIASFSNYGANRVHVAAPGVGIESPVPGNQYLKVSGTSQAAPYVAGVAAAIKDANSELSPTEIKKIILKSVDHRGFLKGKVATAGLINSKRAVMTANLSTKMPLAEALRQARGRVGDVESTKSAPVKTQLVPGSVLPLPSMFK
ncbi:MAG: S8 family serine peptidase [Bacteriovoracaceae bacterium]|nr:S8 family serine peptidase [Bacteriovoracaceae bacterium]